MEYLERIRGCLFGSAIGDALGAPVEFMRRAAIEAAFGPGGIEDFAAAYGGRGCVTDDTQMLLFTAEGLIRAACRTRLEGDCDRTAEVHAAYLRWLATQDRFPDEPGAFEGLNGWLVRDRRLWAHRALGLTCLGALRSSVTLGAPARNDSKGCGTVMRDAPFGLVSPGAPERAFADAVRAAWTTHGHPNARFSSGAIAALVADLAVGSSLAAAIDRTLDLLCAEADAHEVARALQEAIEVSCRPDWLDLLPKLGEGWVAEEALAVGVLCALAGSDPRAALVAAVNHDGDSDSTGAIAGALVGTIRGFRALPDEWTRNVELADILEQLAVDLLEVSGRGPSAESAERLLAVYQRA